MQGYDRPLYFGLPSSTVQVKHKKEDITFMNPKHVNMGAVCSDLELEVENYENIGSIEEDLEK